MSMNYPFIFDIDFFSSGISAGKYVPGASNMDISRLLVASIMRVVVSALVDTVGDDMVYTSFRNRFFSTIRTYSFFNISASIFK